MSQVYAFEVRCGELGTIVGHNDSANFDVAFYLDTRYRGRTCNCHPADLERIEA
jgi:hypothetical protein